MDTTEVSPTVEPAAETTVATIARGSGCHQTHTYHPACTAWPLSDEDLDAMVLSIATSGQKVPILRWRGQIIDGRTRLLACQRIDRDPIIRDIDGELADDAAVWDMVLCLNRDRRHLTRAQLERVIQERLKTSPDVSSRQIARAAGVDHKTVERQRAKLEAGGAIPHVTKRKDSKGRKQPARKSSIRKAYDAQRAALRVPEHAEDAEDMPADAEVKERRPQEETDLVVRLVNLVAAIRKCSRKNGLLKRTIDEMSAEAQELATILQEGPRKCS